MSILFIVMFINISSPVYVFFSSFHTGNVMITLYEPVHEISNNVVCATSKASDQPAHTPGAYAQSDQSLC